MGKKKQMRPYTNRAASHTQHLVLVRNFDYLDVYLKVKTAQHKKSRRIAHGGHQ